MIQRHALAALAMLAMGLLAAARAEAGTTTGTTTSGAVGVKKTAAVKITNRTSNSYYVLVIPASLATSKKFGTPGTVGWARKLGAVLVNPGATVSYPVPAGVFGMTMYVPADIPQNGNAPLPDLVAGAEGVVAKGRNSTKTIVGSPPKILPPFDPEP